MITIPPTACLEECGKTLLSQKARMPPRQVPWSSIWDSINPISLVHNEYTGMFGKFTIKALVASSRENFPEGLSVLESQQSFSVVTVMTKVASNFFFSECMFLQSFVKYHKVLNGPITVSMGTCVRKITYRQM